MIQAWLIMGVAVFIYSQWCFSDVKPMPREEGMLPWPVHWVISKAMTILTWPLVLFVCGLKEGAYQINGLNFDDIMRMAGHDDWQITEEDES